MITLVIVDCQNDFITGTVAVKGAKTAVEEIKKFIKNHKKEIDKILFAIDWHPYNHSSFKEYKGNLPHHCIQYTPGACIEPKMLKFVQSNKINYEVSTRGEIEEITPSGAFVEIDFAQDNLGKRYYFDSVVTADANTDFVICGTTGDTDVLNTISNLLSEKIVPKIFAPGTSSNDNGKSINQLIKQFGLEKIV